MAIRKEMMAGGMSVGEALGAVGSTQDAQTALGTNQATAFALAAANTIFTTVAAGTGAILRNDLAAGDYQEVFNLGANALAVYPPVGGSIHGAAVNAAATVPAGKSGVFTVRAGLNFTSQIGA